MYFIIYQYIPLRISILYSKSCVCFFKDGGVGGQITVAAQ